jgi:hypothetical protein
MRMDSKNKDTFALPDIQSIINGYTSTQDADKSEVLKTIDRDAVVHDVSNAIQKKIAVMVKACRKSCIGKSAEEREVVLWATLDKIEEITSQDVQTARDTVFYNKGKHDAMDSAVRALNAAWDAGIADLQRINEVADLIKSGDTPINGKNRKPGTRPEKLSVIRRAQEEVNATSESSVQENE